MKKILTYLLCAAALLASCKNKEVLFTYSPDTPRAGEPVRFSNQTEEGEDWAWDFGDGTQSSSKTPVKTFRQPGSYTVVLKVDKKATRTCTKTITVIDTIPAIGLSSSEVLYFEPVTISAQAYNPYYLEQTYQWEIGGRDSIISGDDKSASVTVIFLEKNVDITVRCRYTQGGKEYQMEKTFFVKDQPARNVFMATRDSLLSQRIFKYGFEDAIPLDLKGEHFVENPSALLLLADSLYILNDDPSNEGMIARLNITNSQAEALIRNGQTGYGYENGCFYGTTMYWTSLDRIFIASSSGSGRTFDADGSMKVTDAATLGLAAGLHAGGIARFNGQYLYAYDKGIHRFGDDLTIASTILGNQTILHFTLDPIARKIYYVTAAGLSVCNMDGAQSVLIDSKANSHCVTIDNDDNILLWTTNNGVFYMPLIQANNNQFNKANIKQLNTIGNIQAVVADKTERLAAK